MGNEFQTEFEFELPRGYVAEGGELHRNGTMRLATASDEILPMKDPRVQQNPAYLSVILLSRVVTKLGTLQNVSPNVIENLYTGDFDFLHNLYNRINQSGSETVEVSCPKCKHKFEFEEETSGE